MLRERTKVKLSHEKKSSRGHREDELTVLEEKKSWDHLVIFFYFYEKKNLFQMIISNKTHVRPIQDFRKKQNGLQGYHKQL
jgi:hypothetical protein